MFDISAILTFHKEKCIAAPSILSAVMCRDECARAQISVELIGVLDFADEQTKEIVESLSRKHEIRLIETEIGNCGGVRNEGVRICRGNYCAFLDGDDLWGFKWLRLAHEMASNEADKAAYHPEANFYFGGDEHVFVHVRPTDADFTTRMFAVDNYWTALTFSHRDILVEHPLQIHRHSDGFGYEDWHWHRTTLGLGIRHVIVPGTVHYIRRRPESLRAVASNERALPMPSRAFTQLMYKKSG